MELISIASNIGLQLAKDYIARGFPIIPVPYGSKSPNLKGWPELEVTLANAGEYFSAAASNIAIALGRESSNLVDLDLDTDDAVHFAKIIAAPTGCVWGRDLRPASHRLYRIIGEIASPLTFAMPNGEMIVEVRGKNQLSVLPGSKSPEGDNYIFQSDGIPSPVSYDQLKRNAAIIAICVLCARHWPKKGSRNQAALSLSGLLYKSGATIDEAKLILKSVAESVCDEEVDSRVKAATETWKKAESGAVITGISVLREIFGDPAVARLREWLGINESQLDDELIEEFNREHAVVGVGNKCKILRETFPEGALQKQVSLIERNDFFALHANKRIIVNGKETELAKLWFKHPKRRQYTQLVFQPGKEVGSETYNMWTGFNVLPSYGKGCGLILAHIRDVIASGNEEIFQWIISWLAQAVQQPYNKPGTCIVLQGDQGVGKSMLGDYLSRIYGKHYVSVSQPRHIQGNFNAHLQHCAFLNAEEAFWGGDKKSTGVLKDLITSKTMAIEKKGVDVVEGENHLRVLMTTNSDWAIPADFGERRFSVIFVSSAMKGNTKYFELLADEMNTTGPADLLGYLLSHDYTTVNLREPVKTKALAEQILQGTDKLGQFVFKCLYEGKIYPDNPSWPSKIPTDDFTELFVKWSKDHALKGNALATYFGKGVRRYIPGIEKKKLTTSGLDIESGQSIMHTSSHKRMFYILPTLAEARVQFGKVLNNPYPWPEEDAE